MLNTSQPRRRIKIEEKAKVVAAAGGQNRLISLPR